MATRDEKNTFSAVILTKAERCEADCLDIIVQYCEEVGIEIETAASLINDVLKSKLMEEAQILRYLPRSAKLPI
jgi:hypothetical protein